VHYSPDIAPFSTEKRAATEEPAAILSQFGYSGTVQPLELQLGMGLPSARLGSAAVVRNRVSAAKARMIRLTVLLLCERVRTVIHCRRQKGFLHLIKSDIFSEIVNFDETEIRSRGL
jgi:hypothetical protein